ncbi:MAG: MFS transporter [Rhizobiales bacterium]|nr:MFS transporter [Hyphomicrobiales bacterium]
MTTPPARPGNVLGLSVAIASITAVGLGLSLTIPLLSLTLESRGVAPGWIGINTAASGLASMVATPFVPRLAARFGTGMVLAICILASAAMLPFFYVVESFPLWFPLRLVSGAAIGGAFVLSEFWIADAAPAARRGFVMGIYATVFSLGLALGPALLALTGTTGFLPFGVGAAVMAVAALPVMVAPVTSPRLDSHPSRSFLRFLTAAPVATAAALVFGLAESSSFALLPVYGTHVGHPASMVIFLASAVTIGNVALQLPLGMLSDRMDRRRLLLVLAFIGFAGAALLPLAIADFSEAIILLFVWGGCIGGLYTVGLAHLAQRFTGADLAAANSTFLFAYSGGVLVGPALLGLSIEAWDPHGFAAALAFCFLLYFVLVLARMANLRRSPNADAPGP